MAGRTNCSQLQIPFCWCQLLKRRLSLNRFLQNFSSIFLSVAGFFYIFMFILPWDSFMWLNWIRFYQLVFFRDFKLPRRRLSPHRFNQKIWFYFMYVAWFFFVIRFIFPWDSLCVLTGSVSVSWSVLGTSSSPKEDSASTESPWILVPAFFPWPGSFFVFRQGLTHNQQTKQRQHEGSPYA